jgi:hypothetical protein
MAKQKGFTSCRCNLADMLNHCPKYSSSQLGARIANGACRIRILICPIAYLTMFPQWGYFEVGLYTGSLKNREATLSDFKLGRLDVGSWCLDHDIICLLTD